MGAVYKALHLAFDELRALKVIAPELLTDELFVKRFKHEAVITRKLQHPNAVRVDDIDEAEDGRPFIVMEFIEGKSLKQIIREEGPLPWQRVCTIIKQAGAALEAAHKLGMVHRDIKPENISLVESPEGETVKVLDFGIAKVKEARMGEGQGLTLTGTGVVIGTPQYMSPEQAMGKRGDELDGRADLYSLGIVMYQMLTADLPFKADTTMEMLLAHMQKPPNPIWVVHPELGVPQPIALLTMRLLEKNRDLRPASARALIQEIEKAEKESANVNRTRVLTTEDVMQANANRSPVIDQGGVVVPPRPQPQPPPVRPPEPQPRVVPQPVIRPQPPPQPYIPPRPKPQESRWGMWVAMIVLIVGVGGGGWYIFTHSNNNTVATVSATLSAAPTAVDRGKAVTLTWNSQNASALDLEPGVGKVQASGSTTVAPQDSTTYTLTATGEGGTQTSSTRVTVTAPEVVQQEKTTSPTEQITKTQRTKRPEERKNVAKPETVHVVDQAKVQAKITEGNFYLGRGEYSDAIKAYEEGLELDPGNTTLRDKIEKAKHAQETEQKVGVQ
jgi:serine/threonine protein kinase